MKVIVEGAASQTTPTYVPRIVTTAGGGGGESSPRVQVSGVIAIRPVEQAIQPTVKESQMAAKFKKGSKVRQVVPTITGEVTETKYDEAADCLTYHVEYKDAEGNDSARWFTEDQLEEHA